MLWNMEGKMYFDLQKGEARGKGGRGGCVRKDWRF